MHKCPRPYSSSVPVTQATCTAWRSRGLLAAGAEGLLDRLFPGLLGTGFVGSASPQAFLTGFPHCPQISEVSALKIT